MLVRQVAIVEDLSEQAGADRFAGVDGDGRDSAIGMLQSMMAALNADDLEAELFQRSDEFFTGDSLTAWHQATLTC